MMRPIMPMNPVVLQRAFSDYFRDIDKEAIIEFDNTFIHNKQYIRIMDQWKKPLENKRLRRLRKLENPPHIVPDEVGDGLMSIHNAQEGITLPPHPNKIFAIVDIKGLQVRVVKDFKVMVNDLGEDFKVGQQLVLDDVRMIGTRDYTCLGRPTVGNARVIATIEERTRSEKVIIFKKKRRQGY